MKNINENLLIRSGLGFFFIYVAIILVLIMNLFFATQSCEVSGITMILVYFVLPIAIISLTLILLGSFRGYKNVKNAQGDN
ncbi:MAG: hypothetical protein ABH919_02725 [bacterium]